MSIMKIPKKHRGPHDGPRVPHAGSATKALACHMRPACLRPLAGY